MQFRVLIAVVLMLSLSILACQQTGQDQERAEMKPMITDVVTAEAQAEMNGEAVLNDLKAGHQRFLNNNLQSRDLMAQAEKTAGGQYPKAAILSCVDSRVPVEYIFDQGIGDIFVARVAGNFMDEDMLGSAEFACKVAGSKLLMVMGHESCGAVKAAIDDVELGNITPMLDKIHPAVDMSEDFKGDQTSKNPEFVSYVVENNVKYNIDNIRRNSPILKEMEDNGEIRIVGAVYSLSTGQVTFLDY